TKSAPKSIQRRMPCMWAGRARLFFLRLRQASRLGGQRIFGRFIVCKRYGRLVLAVYCNDISAGLRGRQVVGVCCARRCWPGGIAADGVAVAGTGFGGWFVQRSR